MDPTQFGGVETIFPMRLADLHAVSDTCILHMERRKPDQRFLTERRARVEAYASAARPGSAYSFGPRSLGAAHTASTVSSSRSGW
jgi:hypothetical protein